MKCSDLELEVILASIDFIKMDKGFLADFTLENLNTENRTWEEIYFRNSEVSEALYLDWISKSQSSVSLKLNLQNPKTYLLPMEKYKNYFDNPENKWQSFFQISRPGISADESKAIIQVTAKSPSGTPNYSSLLYLEKTIHFWNVISVHSF
jgi:hypothetical protein